ncbi:MAG: hypothetical protein AVDCRST_MAG60-1597, partial [uncultured Nocardioides sp.]
MGAAGDGLGVLEDGGVRARPDRVVTCDPDGAAGAGRMGAGTDWVRACADRVRTCADRVRTC